MNFFLILAIEFWKKKKIMGVLRIKNLKCDKNFQRTHCFFYYKIYYKVCYKEMKQ